MIINHYKHRINKNICDTHLAHGSRVGKSEISEIQDKFMAES